MAQRKLTSYFGKDKMIKNKEILYFVESENEKLEDSEEDCMCEDEFEDEPDEDEYDELEYEDNDDDLSDDITILPPCKVSKTTTTTSITKRYRETKGKVRMDLVAKYCWLVPKSDGSGCLCKFCSKYYTSSRGLPKGSDGMFIRKPFTNWSKATGSSSKTNKLLKHQESKSHKVAIAEAEMSSTVEQ